VSPETKKKKERRHRKDKPLIKVYLEKAKGKNEG